MGNYSLPGVQLTDITSIPAAPPTVEAGSSQRLPCIIGTASHQKAKMYEEVPRSTTGNVDNLIDYSTGIASIISAGTQRGLTDLFENVDFTVNSVTGEITWIVNTEVRAISNGVYGEELFNSLTDFALPAAPVAGVNAIPGSQGLGLDIISTANSGLLVNTTYEFSVNAVNYSITTPTPASGIITVGDVALLMNAALAVSPFTATFVTNDIIVSTKLSGAGNTVTLAAGAANNIFTAFGVLWTAFATAVPGANSTSGYQGLGLSVAAIDDTGLLPEMRYYFKINSAVYSILTGAGTTDYAALVALLNAALSGGTLSCAFTAGDVVFTNAVLGVSSSVAIGTADPVSATNSQLTVNIGSGTIFSRLPGKVTITCTVGAEDLTFGIGDSIDPGDSTIVLSGSNDDLNKLQIGTVLTISTVPAVAPGGRYFVSYYYNRAADDYGYKEFTSYDALKADLGPCVPTSQIVMLAYLCFEVYGLPKIACIQVPASNLNSDYVAALQKCRNRDIQTLCMLNSSVSVRNAAIVHINDRNLPKNGMLRVLYTGAPALTPVGDINTPTSLAGMAKKIKKETVAFVNVTRALYTSEGLSVTVDGAFVASAVGCYRDSFTHPAQNLLRYTVPGLILFSEDYETYYSRDALLAAGEGSVFLIGLDANNSMLVKDDLTTDNSSVEANNINIITAKHYIAKDVATNLDNTFIGNLIEDRGTYKTTVMNYLIELFKQYKSAKIIEKMGQLKVELPTTRRDTVKIAYSYYAVYSHKYVTGEYFIAI